MQARHYAPISLCAFLEPDDQLNVEKSQNSRLRNTQRSEEDAHGYHHASHNCPSRFVACRRRLVRPWTLVLNVADFKISSWHGAATLQHPFLPGTHDVLRTRGHFFIRMRSIHIECGGWRRQAVQRRAKSNLKIVPGRNLTHQHRHE
jgi:hypothetical protein